ncbi:uncharacterized protein [Canis lupus baileyi]|uniref:uncharacterized protein isoform X6 n=1 Tax=Canis lupus baileyi TaxID=143281 RepID=UPI003B96BF83
MSSLQWSPFLATSHKGDQALNHTSQDERTAHQKTWHTQVSQLLQQLASMKLARGKHIQRDGDVLGMRCSSQLCWEDKTPTLPHNLPCAGAFT